MDFTFDYDLLDLIVCKSNAGYYIGTLDDEGFPNSRNSVEYFATREEAASALSSGAYTPRLHP